MLHAKIKKISGTYCYMYPC